MPRVLAVLLLVSCGRSAGVADEDLGGLVISPRQKPQPIDVDRAVKNSDELGRALALRERDVAAAIGAHVLSINVQTTVSEGGKQVSDLGDHTVIELGDKGAYHALYTNSADYGREITFVGGMLYLRPRYQRWHARAPESPDEPAKLRDDLAEAIEATWDLFAPAAEPTEVGAAPVGGRPGRKIAIKLSPDPKTPPAEVLAQRKWREHRSFEALTGEVVLDADSGVPLAVKLDGTIGFSRDGRRFTMKIVLDAAVSGVGHVAELAAPTGDDVVATPERLREVDDRDYLLQGIAPPLRKNPDGTPITPAPPARPVPAPSSKKP